MRIRAALENQRGAMYGTLPSNESEDEGKNTMLSSLFDANFTVRINIVSSEFPYEYGDGSCCFTLK